VKILIVEDRPDHLRLAHDVLSAEGHEIRDAAGAREAWESIRQDRPDIILLDLSLPGIDGLTLARKLKNDPKTRSIHIVAVTAYPDNWKKEMVLGAGCEGFLLKPISVRTLAQDLADAAEGDSSL